MSSHWDIKTILLESFFILLAVLLALWLNEWNNERNNQKMVVQILESARHEISDNLELINTTVEYRDQLLTEIRSGRREIQRIENFTEKATFEFTNQAALSRFLDDIFISEGVLDLVGSDIYPAPGGGYWMSFFGRSVKLELDGNDLVAYGPGNIQLRPAFLSNTAWITANVSNTLIHMDFKTLSTLSDIYSTQESYADISRQALRLLYAEGNIQSAMEDMFWLERALQRKYSSFLENF